MTKLIVAFLNFAEASKTHSVRHFQEPSSLVIYFVKTATQLTQPAYVILHCETSLTNLGLPFAYKFHLIQAISDLTSKNVVSEDTKELTGPSGEERGDWITVLPQGQYRFTAQETKTNKYSCAFSQDQWRPGRVNKNVPTQKINLKISQQLTEFPCLWLNNLKSVKHRK